MKLSLQVTGDQEEVERRQGDTFAADVLEARYAASLDFGGIQTDQVHRRHPKMPYKLCSMERLSRLWHGGQSCGSIKLSQPSTEDIQALTEA